MRGEIEIRLWEIMESMIKGKENMRDREYKVSVVTAVYNVEAYLGEMI